MIDINIVARSFLNYCIAALVRVYRMFGQKLNMLFIKYQHLRRQQKNGVPVDLLVAIKTPAEGSLISKDTA
jgi:hypothetical protein